MRQIQTQAKRSHAIVFLCSAMLCAAGCTPPQPAAPPPPPRVLSYSFTPPSSAAPGSANVVLAVVQPQWANASERNLFSFTAQMKGDFMSLVTARGFATRGPFVSYQDMVYPDKTGSDLILTPNIGLTAQFSEPTLALGSFVERMTEPKVNGQMVAGPYRASGTVTLRGKVELTLTESMTNERMWTKNITIDPIVVSYKGQKLYHQVNGPLHSVNMAAFLYDDPGFQAAVYPQLEQLYKTIMQKSWDYLDPHELADVKAQAASLKKK